VASVLTFLYDNKLSVDEKNDCCVNCIASLVFFIVSLSYFVYLNIKESNRAANEAEIINSIGENLVY
jgi:hypothetical protein